MIPRFPCQLAMATPMMEVMNEGIQEVVSIVLDVEKRLAATIDERMHAFEKRFITTMCESIEASERRVMSTLNERIGGIETRLVPIERKLTSIEENVIEMQEDLNAGLRAIDEHALGLLDHTKRIRRLEKRMA